jgi:hypothetical protein
MEVLESLIIKYQTRRRDASRTKAVDKTVAKKAAGKRQLASHR